MIKCTLSMLYLFISFRESIAKLSVRTRALIIRLHSISGEILIKFWRWNGDARSKLSYSFVKTLFVDDAILNQIRTFSQKLCFEGDEWKEKRKRMVEKGNERRGKRKRKREKNKREKLEITHRDDRREEGNLVVKIVRCVPVDKATWTWGFHTGTKDLTWWTMYKG